MAHQKNPQNLFVHVITTQVVTIGHYYELLLTLNSNFLE